MLFKLKKSDEKKSLGLNASVAISYSTQIPMLKNGPGKSCWGDCMVQEMLISPYS